MEDVPSLPGPREVQTPPRSSEALTFLAFILFLFASAAPIPGMQTGMRVAIIAGLALFAPVIVRFRATAREKSFLLYLLFVATFVREWDYFSKRLLFNLLALGAGVLLARLARFRRWMLWTGAGIMLAVAVVRALLPTDAMDGKLQVHAEVLLVASLLLVLVEGPRRAYLAAALTAIVFRIRSVTFAAGAVAALARRHVLLAFLVMYLAYLVIVENIDWLSRYADADSLRWRIDHWSMILEGFGWRDWLFGRGLGYSWRVSIDFVRWTDYEGYFAAHSNYVKIIAETGLVGLAAFVLCVVQLARGASPLQKRILFLYLGYGFFDEGIWHFSVLWIFLVSDTWMWKRELASQPEEAVGPPRLASGA